MVLTFLADMTIQNTSKAMELTKELKPGAR